MTGITLDSPIPGVTVTTIEITSLTVDLENNSAVIGYRQKDANGVEVKRTTIALVPAQVTNWITNNRATLYTALKAALNVSGTVT